MAEDYFLEQCIRKPTRGKNILDLTFCNNPYLIRGYKIIINSSVSDHSTISENISQNYNVKIKHIRNKPA